MTDRENSLFSYAKGRFISTMRLFTPELQRWIQYKGYEIDEKSDMVTFLFKSSQHAIHFECSAKLFSALYGKVDFINPDNAYRYFKGVKLNEV
jgi:hypothetical protein